MQQDLMNEAWAAYAEAEKFDQKRTRLTGEGKHTLAANAQRAAERQLERAAALETAAIANEAVPA